MKRRRGSSVQVNNAEPVQCYMCGRSIAPAYAVERIEQRMATRFHGKRVKICIYCAEEWDEDFPDSIPPKEEPQPVPEVQEAAGDAGAEKAERAAAEKAAEQDEEEDIFPPQPANRGVVIDTNVPLTKRQQERLAWYQGSAPLRGYDVKEAILRDDRLAAVACRAERMGLSYGYLMVLQQKAEQQS